MTQEPSSSVEPSLAAQAFAELRGEVSLLRRAVERLTDERTSTPEIGPSLEAIARRLEDVCTWAERVSKKPALQLTPTTFASEIIEAATSSREQDHQLFREAARTLGEAVAQIDDAVARPLAASVQQRVLLCNRIGFAVAGMVTVAILPGVVARSLPVSWAAPERMAARMLGADMWHAGEQLMRKAERERWGVTKAQNRPQARKPNRGQ